MADTEISFIMNSCDKQIEDVIDARKQTGQYNIYTYQSNTAISSNLTCRGVCSVPVTGNSEETKNYSRTTFDDVTTWNSEGKLYNYSTDSASLGSAGPTDSEITIVRVKRRGLCNKISENMWNLRDIAVPGDGTHLGESPSLVNLVTLVTCDKCDHYDDEYFVPLSSWDPTDNPYEFPDIQQTVSCNTINASGFEDNDRFKLQFNVIKAPGNRKCLSLAGKISNFLRKRRDRKSKVVLCDNSDNNENFRKNEE